MKFRLVTKLPQAIGGLNGHTNICSGTKTRGSHSEIEGPPHGIVGTEDKVLAVCETQDVASTCAKGKPKPHTTCSTGCMSMSKVSRNFDVMM
jgi:hypothetical protein